MANDNEIRAEVYHDLGCAADERLEAAQNGLQGFIGAGKALMVAAKNVGGFVEFVKQDLEKGKLQSMEPTEVAKYAIVQIQRAVDSLNLAAVNNKRQSVAQQGEVATHQFYVAEMVKLRDKARADEKRRIAKIASAVTEGTVKIEDDGSLTQVAPGARLSGARPTGGVAASRKAEEREAKKKPPAKKKPRPKPKPKPKPKK